APDAFDDISAEVVVLEIERTFWEKATILHAEYHRPMDKKFFIHYARHYADFAALWRHPSAQSARGRLDLLKRVREFKAHFYSSGWANYATASPGTFRLVPPEHRLPELRADYDAMRQMFMSEPLRFDDVLAALREAEEVINRQ